MVQKAIKKCTKKTCFLDSKKEAKVARDWDGAKERGIPQEADISQEKLLSGVVYTFYILKFIFQNASFCSFECLFSQKPFLFCECSIFFYLRDINSYFTLFYFIQSSFPPSFFSSAYLISVLSCQTFFRHLVIFGSLLIIKMGVS